MKKIWYGLETWRNRMKKEFGKRVKWRLVLKAIDNSDRAV